MLKERKMRSSFYNVVINWQTIYRKESVDEFTELGHSESAEDEV